jgi:hypothetical protein
MFFVAVQALQHAWIMSSYPDEMEECSLVWDDDPDYNIMTGDYDPCSALTNVSDWELEYFS